MGMEDRSSLDNMPGSLLVKTHDAKVRADLRVCSRILMDESLCYQGLLILFFPQGVAILCHFVNTVLLSRQVHYTTVLWYVDGIFCSGPLLVRVTVWATQKAPMPRDKK